MIDAMIFWNCWQYSGYELNELNNSDYHRNVFEEKLFEDILSLKQKFLIGQWKKMFWRNSDTKTESEDFIAQFQILIWRKNCS